MKLALAFLMTIFSTLSFASTDRVGDFIHYAPTSDNLNAEMSMEYINFDGQDMYQRTQMINDSQVIVDEVTRVKKENIVTMQSVGLLIALCSQYGGTHEYLELPVGKTLTCKLETNKFKHINKLNIKASTVWLGPFPITAIAQMKVEGQLFKVVNYHWDN